MPQFDMIFFVGLVLALGGLGISSFIESYDPAKKTQGEQFFALLYLVAVAGLILYKMQSR
jgi:hypothetical protein